MRISQRQGLFGGVAVLSFATLVLQITLTRLYSALFGHHLAFLAISLSLFGVGLGGVLLYLIPRLIRPEALLARLTQLSAAASIASVATVVYVVRSSPIEALDISSLARLAGLYLVSSLPFVLVGIAVAAALRHAGADVSKLYLYDMVGAAAGALGAIAALRAGAPRAGLIVAVLIALAGLLFAFGDRDRKGKPAHDPSSVSLAATFLAGTLSMLAGDVGAPWLKPPRLKHAERAEFQKWNELALVTVDKPEKGMAWMRMDGSAATAILDPKTTPPLHPDEMAYVLHKDKGPVLVIGAGGGRDIRAALKAGQKEVYAAEINRVIVDDVMRGKYRDWSGGLYDKPEVRVSVADGRSYVRSSPLRFRNIVLSLVDTWAAASVGALALSENSLYTVEAFHDYLEHLTPDGTLLVNRWDPEFDRLLALAVAGLRSVGVSTPAEHMFACSASRSTSLLVKRTPLTRDEREQLRAHCKKKKFTEVFAPDAPGTELRGRIAALADVRRAAPAHPTDLEAPTDDRPFFFYTVPTRLLHKALADYKGLQAQNQGLLTLIGILVVSAVIAAGALLGPLLLARSSASRGGRGADLRALVFFLCLGAGFVFVEVSLVQHFVMFLGHPVYALSTVLVALLLWTGVGSLLTSRIALEVSAVAAARRAELLVVLLAAYAAGLGPLLSVAVGLPLVLRLVITIALLAPLGILMGSQVPLGLRLTSARAPSLVPWCWGLNGLASVLATALGTLLAMHLGFSAVLLAGATAYLVAVATTPTPAAVA